MSQQIALITGSSRGIGRHIALKLARENYTVIVNGRNEADVTAVMLQIQKEGGKAVELIGDMTTEAGLKQAAELVRFHDGNLDLLVCNIGSGKTSGDLTIDIAEWKRMFDLNFFSAVSAVNTLLPFIEKNHGHIVLMSSIAAVEKMFTPAIYGVTKAALLSYMQQMMRPLAEKKIRINAVSPGPVWVEGGSWDKKMRQDPQGVNNLIQNNVALQQFVQADEVAAAVWFLQNTNSMNGQNIIVDAGYTRQT
jgi:3-oxoacyl-[acyl-carrier protein] reductase